MTSPNDDLRSLISAAKGASDQPKAGQKQSPSPTSSAPRKPGNDDLQSLISQANNPTAFPGAGAERTAPKQRDVQGALERAIESAQAREQRESQPRNPAIRPSNSIAPADLSHAVEQAHAAVGASGSAASKPSALSNPRVILAGLVLALLVVAFGVWRNLQTVLTGHPATLHALAQAVEQYRSSHNGSLPEQLSNLEQFPKNAVEWQVKHWKARDAAGRTEIMFAPNGSKHYRIVLRQGSEVWVYNDTDGSSKQKQK